MVLEKHVSDSFSNLHKDLVVFNLLGIMEPFEILLKSVPFLLTNALIFCMDFRTSQNPASSFRVPV